MIARFHFFHNFPSRTFSEARLNFLSDLSGRGENPRYTAIFLVKVCGLSPFDPRILVIDRFPPRFLLFPLLFSKSSQ